MTDKERQEIVKLRLENAHNSVKEAELMKDNGFWNATINRMYYACYYAVTALLVENGIQANTHSGVRQMLGLHFIKNQKVVNLLLYILSYSYCNYCNIAIFLFASYRLQYR